MPASAAALPQAECKLGSMLAEFEHFSRNEDAALGRPRGERVNHGLQRFGVGVVAVIQNGGAGDFENFSTLAAGGKGFERGNGGVEIDSRFERNGESGHGVLRVVRAEQMECESSRRARRHGNARGGRRDLP